ncbi:MAG: zinc ribbon domain-containing protein [Eubacterium sp.]|nr:zinc ribbon domain-containing protein [Eubacterium sp.]
MYCSKCGKEVPEVAAFCPFCGEAIVRQVKQDNKPFLWRLIIISFVSLIILVFLISSIIILIRHKQSDESIEVEDTDYTIDLHDKEGALEKTDKNTIMLDTQNITEYSTEITTENTTEATTETTETKTEASTEAPDTMHEAAGNGAYTSVEHFTGKYGDTYEIVEGFKKTGVNEEGDIAEYTFEHLQTGLKLYITEWPRYSDYGEINFKERHENAKNALLNKGATVEWDACYEDRNRSYLTGYLYDNTYVYYRMSNMTSAAYIEIYFEYPNRADNTACEDIIAEFVKEYIDGNGYR